MQYYKRVCENHGFDLFSFFFTFQLLKITMSVLMHATSDFRHFRLLFQQSVTFFFRTMIVLRGKYIIP